MTGQNLPGDNTPPTNEQDVVITEDELSLLGDETSNKIKSLSAQKAHFRDKAKKLAEENELLKKQVTAPPAPPAPPVAPSVVDTDEIARKVAVDMRLDNYLGSVPEDKRATVKEFYSSLTTGKKIDTANFSDFADAAARAAGVVARTNSTGRIASFASGNVPPTNKPGPSAEEIEMAKIAGNDPEKVYGEKVDYSNLLNAHKFVGPKDEV